MSARTLHPLSIGLAPALSVVLLMAAAVGRPAAETPGSAPESAPAAAPVLELDPETVDLGEVVRGETVETRFTIRNAGGDVLRLVRVKPG